MVYILFNSLAGNKTGRQNAQKLVDRFRKERVLFQDVVELKNIYSLLAAVERKDTVILAGGDGTLNYFVNDMNGRELPCKVYYYPVGSGNDFHADCKDYVEDGLIYLNPFVESLPSVTVNGKTSLFLNGIGYGIDGYCCEEGDKLRATSDKPINYTSIAIKGLLFFFKPANAKVTVDGKVYHFKKVWLAPTMNGRFYGGGMMVAPKQDRRNPDGTLSLVVIHKSGKLKTLIVFPSIFKGEHVKHTEMVETLTGREITVEFDRPTALQIDGETVLNVTTYSCSAAKVKAKA